MQFVQCYSGTLFMISKKPIWKNFLKGVAWLLFWIGGMACLDGYTGKGWAIRCFTGVNRLSAEMGDLCLAILCGILGVFAMCAAGRIRNPQKDSESPQK